ncbi:MAG: quinolinate synthase NadA [Candidatus Firestonebacteria bacterium]
MKNNSELVEKILKLKKQRNAIFLVHNYQIEEVQDIADYIGDSLGLSQIASKTDADVIVFCGVHFMAETASILCPDKKVLIPDIDAGCPMADMITAKKLKELKAKHPLATVVAYVNTPAEVKAESDVCCTSANAVKVVLALKDAKEIIFVPDKYLGDYTAKKTGRDMILWDGYCPTHIKIMPEDILKAKSEHPNAKVLVHPECSSEIIALADETRSTEGIAKYVQETDVKEFIIGTEIGMLHRLKKENPDKIFYPASALAVCPNMKKNNLEKILWALEDMKYEVKVPEDIRIKAKIAVDKMIAIGR